MTALVFLELDKRATIDPRGMLSRAYLNATVHVDNAGVTTRCGRCGRDADVHAWRVYDLTDPEHVEDQRGVLDCGFLTDQ